MTRTPALLGLIALAGAVSADGAIQSAKIRGVPDSFVAGRDSSGEPCAVTRGWHDPRLADPFDQAWAITCRGVSAARAQGVVLSLRPDHAKPADHRRLCFFRHSLFVHADAPIRRTPAPDSAERLWLSTDARRTGRHAFELAGDAFDVGDDRLADLLADAAAAAPRRIALAGRGCDAERLTALVALFGRGAVRLHAGQLPAMPPSTRPVASALARAQIARGDPAVAHLGHDLLAIGEPGPRAFLALLDGTRDIDALRRDWAATPYGGEIDVDAALAMFANAALLVG